MNINIQNIKSITYRYNKLDTGTTVKTLTIIDSGGNRHVLNLFADKRTQLTIKKEVK